MGPNTVVVVAPVGDKYLSFEQGREAFAVQEFVSKLATLRFDITVFPGTSQFDEKCLNL